jgi:hypothetical protein
MAQRWIDRQIDDALLATSVSAGVLYARRRVRRVQRRLARGAVIFGAAATIAGIGVAGAAGGAFARYRRRARGSTD